MSHSKSAMRTKLYEAKFGPAIQESEYQKAVHILHWRLRKAKKGAPRPSRYNSYKLKRCWTQVKSSKYSEYSGKISSLCLVTLCAGYREFLCPFEARILLTRYWKI